MSLARPGLRAEAAKGFAASALHPGYDQASKRRGDPQQSPLVAMSAATFKVRNTSLRLWTCRPP